MEVMMRRKHAFRRMALAAVVALVALVLPAVDALAQQSEATFRLLTFEVGSSGPRLGTTRGNGEQDVVDVHNALLYMVKTGAPEVAGLAPIPIDMRSLIEAGDASVAAVKTVHNTITRLRSGSDFTDPGGAHRIFHPSNGISYLPPVPNATKVLAGAGAYLRPNPDGTPGNYDAVEFPSFFLKPPSSLLGHGENINLRGLLTRGVYEPECAVIIGKRAKFITQDEAMNYVFGFLNFNDMSARDLPAGQHRSQGSNMSKGLDTFTPVGPYITLLEDIPNHADLDLVAKVDGVLHEWPHKNGNTGRLTFSLEESLSYLSERMTLEPGDYVSTGVPSPSMPFKVGETVEISIGNLGTLRNTVVSEPAPGWTPIQPRKSETEG